MIIVSACLCGIDCKYNGSNNFNKKVYDLYKRGLAIPVCPEQLGGMKTPRIPHEIVGGSGCDVLEGIAKVQGKNGVDSSEQFIKGAMETLKIAKDLNAETAVLKARSPSCGCGDIYDGSFRGVLKSGNGVTAQLLIDNNIKVYTEENF